MNKLDLSYQSLLQDILDNGVTKQDRTGTGTISVFGRQIRHKMSDGFPLLTTKKMAWKTMVTELLWFLRGDTNIKFLVDNNCHIWTGDAYKDYDKDFDREHPPFSAPYPPRLTVKEFEEKIMIDDEFNKWYGDLGPIYGKQWRNWGGKQVSVKDGNVVTTVNDQISSLINDLKNNPDSRRLMVNAWNVGELDQMVLPPCHYGFQVYTRELSESERFKWYGNKIGSHMHHDHIVQEMNQENVPTRAISLSWNQRSIDTFLGLPFNIASYGLLLEIIAKAVNMVPDELIGNLGDTHLYLNHIEQAKEQIGGNLTLEERIDHWFHTNKPNRDVVDHFDTFGDAQKIMYLDKANVPSRSREPFTLPELKHTKTDEFYKSLSEDLSLFTHLDNTDFTIENYQSHPHIKAPLSN
jgi:thymidylate synthase